MTRLGEMLVEQNLVTPAQLQQALAAQVTSGGRIGSNLVRLGYLREQTLARMLGEQHHMQFAAGDMSADPQAMSIADPEFCDRHNLLPMRVDKTRLTVAVVDPTRLDAIDALRFRASRKVVTVIIPEFRMRQLLSERLPRTSPPPLETSNATQIVRRPLLDGDEHQPHAIDVDPFEDVDTDRVPAASDDPFAPSTSQDADTDPALTSFSWIRSVGSFDEAKTAVAQATSGDEIASIVLGFGLGIFRRAVLLSVEPKFLCGWHCAGDGVDLQACHRVQIPRDQSNALTLVVNLKSNFVGPVRETESLRAFFEVLGGERPVTSAVIPVIVAGDVLHLLYVDNGAGQLTSPSIEEMVQVIAAAARRFEEFANVWNSVNRGDGPRA